jgi:RNA polymerase sigma-70 factor (ECF subfamily)
LPTRVGPDGVAQLLEDQPREKWDRSLIALGLAHLDRSARGNALTVWHLRAEIAAVHATALSTEATDWARIVRVYDRLREVDSSPVVELARAVAVRRARGPAAGLEALPTPNGNPYGHAATAIFLTELGRTDEARVHFEKAMALARTEPERRLLQRRLTS